MTYKNYTNEAIRELERQRIGYYDDYAQIENDTECSECKRNHGQFFNINNHIYCSECICEMLRESYDGIAENLPCDNVSSGEILKDIIADFSDNELLCYIENKYEKIEN